MSVIIWILLEIIIGSLPRNEGFIHWIDLLYMPLMKCFGRQIRTPAKFHKHFENLYFPEPSTEILFPKRTMGGSIGCF